MKTIAQKLLSLISPVKRAGRQTRKGPLTLERLEGRLALAGFGPEDGAYIVEPWLGQYRDVAVQPGDQKIVTAGFMNTTESRMAVARYDSLGSADATYGSGGIATPALTAGNDHAYGLALQSDGKAVVTGNIGVSGRIDLGVARFNTNGALDNSFGSGGWSSFHVPSATNTQETYGIGLQSSGKIVVDGFASFTSSNSAVATRFKASGAIDSGNGGFGQQKNGYALNSFGSQYATFGDLVVQSDDKVVAVGTITPDGSNGRLIVARFSASGTLDTAFGSGGYSVLLPAGFAVSYGEAVALQPDGKIIVAGSSSGIDGTGDLLVARFNAGGTLDTSFGGSGYFRLDIDGTTTPTRETGRDVVIRPDGKIVVVGYESIPAAGAVSSVLVARFNQDGTPDSTFAAGGFKLGAAQVGTGFHDFRGQAVALESDGSIIVAGIDYWGTTGSTAHPLLMRFSGDSAPLAMAGSSTSDSSAAATDAALMMLLANDPQTIAKRRSA